MLGFLAVSSRFWNDLRSLPESYIVGVYKLSFYLDQAQDEWQLEMSVRHVSALQEQNVQHRQQLWKYYAFFICIFFLDEAALTFVRVSLRLRLFLV